MKKKIVVNDKMQKGYTYFLVEPVGKNFDPEFKPELTPKEMLTLGVFGGKYMSDCKKEFPREWFTNVQFCPERHNPALNYFSINASKPLSYWQKMGWIYPEDPRGWFQWYCRYFIGRRCPDDERQFKRWKAFRRHIGAILKNCPAGALDCRRRQRQALLHWAYDSRKI